MAVTTSASVSAVVTGERKRPRKFRLKTIGDPIMAMRGGRKKDKDKKKPSRGGRKTSRGGRKRR